MRKITAMKREMFLNHFMLLKRTLDLEKALSEGERQEANVEEILTRISKDKDLAWEIIKPFSKALDEMSIKKRVKNRERFEELYHSYTLMEYRLHALKQAKKEAI